MPDKFEFYYRCFCCGYLVSDIEYESAYVFARCPRCHVGVENFVPEAHLTKRALDVRQAGVIIGQILVPAASNASPLWTNTPISGRGIISKRS